MIRESLKGVTKHSDKADILTPWKEVDRRRREVYTPAGTPDAASRQGLFHRSANSSRPQLNSRPGGYTQRGRDSLRSFVTDNSRDEDEGD